MGKSSPSMPSAPDPKDTANAQAAANSATAITQARLNRINQVTPYGSLTYQMTGYEKPVQMADGTWYARRPEGDATTYNDYNVADANARQATGQYQAVQTLSPEQQRIYNAQVAAQGNLGDIAVSGSDRLKGLLSSTFTPAGLPSNITSINTPDFAQQRQQLEDINYQGQTRKLDPYYAQQEAALKQSLADKGIPEGSEAYNTLMGNFSRERTDAYQQARNASTLAGAQEQQALRAQALQEGLANANLTNSQRAAMLQEQLGLRNQPINEITGLLSGVGVTNPSFANVPQVSVGGTDVTGAYNNAYQGALNNYNAQMQQRNATTSGLANLLGTGISAAGMFFSDRRLKTNIQRIGKASNGLNLYAFDYIWGGGRQIGLMADEVKLVKPHAVTNIGGYDAVDYAEALNG